jgi:hypothetical protein
VLIESFDVLFYREAKLGGLPPTHQSESLKTNGFQIKLAEALSNSVACGRVFDNGPSSKICLNADSY